MTNVVTQLNLLEDMWVNGSHSVFLTYLANNPLLIAASIGASVTITAAFLTYHGVRLSLEHAALRQKQDLQHAAERQKQDLQHKADEGHISRITTARREIYLTAIDELVKAQMRFGSLPKVDLSKENPILSLEAFLSATAKISIIANLPTTYKAREISTAIVATYVKAIGFLLPIIGIKNEVETWNDLLSKSRAETERLLAAMTSHNEKRIDDYAGFEILHTAFEQNQKYVLSQGEEYTKALQRLSDFELQYGQSIKSEMIVLTQALDELGSLMRTELGLQSDVNEWQRLSTENIARYDEVINDLIQQASKSTSR